MRVAPVGNKDVSLRVDGEISEVGGERAFAVAWRAPFRQEPAAAVEPLNAGTAGIADVDITLIHGHAKRGVELAVPDTRASHFVKNLPRLLNFSIREFK
jgi:hypothetical protein